VFVDSNILIHAANAGSPNHDPARDFLAGLRDGITPWFISLQVAYEFLRVVTHQRIFPRPMTRDEALDFLEAVIDCRSVSLLRDSADHLVFLRKTWAQLDDLTGSALHDLHIAITMQEHGVSRIATLDRRFERFAFLEVVNPFE